MDFPLAAFTKELSRRHQQKDIRFLEALAVLEALHCFFPLWDGPRHVVVHVNNKNIKYGLRKGSIQDPQTQVLVQAIFAFSFLKPLLYYASTLLTQLTAPSLLPANISPPSPPLSVATPFPASETLLIEWVVTQHTTNKTYGSIKCDLTIVKSWHIDLSLSTVVFDSKHLARNHQMSRAAFCLTFTCFLHLGELTWEAQGTDNMLMVSSVSFATDKSFATVTIPASKTDRFQQDATLTAPAIPLSTCDWPFDRSSFVTTLRQCLTTCKVETSAYSGHSFHHGAATWTASNGVDDTTIHGLGQWWSNCFRHYIDKSAIDQVAITKAALYTNTSAPLSLDTFTWRNL
ncbi:uncharacterized protein UBRO2_04314 [Ustilago bromivora]|uniref:Uncharacterized protein n=1 Tax=Ustilago bromivora TaxID=307758 RepID=A0A8H8QQG0_9BASI|nr:uncharacterized protein UBRO2_04314 [Ustilago bromivora]